MIKFKKISILQWLSYFNLVVLLAGGFYLAPSHATTNVTYYTFVMYKLETGNWQQLYHYDKLQPAHYQFQIVRFSSSNQKASTDWAILQGNFQFKSDPHGGVKIDTRQKSFYQQNAFGSWSNITKNWKRERQKQLQPIIGYMEKEEPLGHPDPNLMRFLLLKTNTEESWQLWDRNYHIYRLHYFNKYTDDTTNPDNLKALSRFINPSVEPTTNLFQLKKWLDNPSFGISDENRAFYDKFKQWFNQSFEIETPPVQVPDNEEEMTPVLNNSEEGYLWVGIILVMFVVIIGILIKFTRRRQIQQNENIHFDEGVKTDNAEQYASFVQKLKTPFSLAKQTEIQTLKQEIEQLQATVQQLQEQNTNQQITSEREISKIMWKILNDQYPLLLSNLTPRLLREADFRKTIENHIDEYLNGQFNNDVNKTLEVYAEKYWHEFMAENQPKTDSTKAPTDFVIPQLSMNDSNSNEASTKEAQIKEAPTKE